MTIISSDPQLIERQRNLQYLKKVLDRLTDRQVSHVIYLINMESNRRSSRGLHFIDLSGIQDVNRKEGLKERLVGLDNLKEYLDDKIIQMQANLLPESEFDWLKKDLRRQVSCLRALELGSHWHFSKLEMNKQPLDSIYSYIDNLFIVTAEGYVPATLDCKANILANIKSFLNTNRESESYTRWLNINDKNQIEWAQNYLQRNGYYINNLNIDISHIEVVRDIVLSSLDTIYLLIYPTNYVSCMANEKLLFIDKMKRAWSQKKFRDASKTKSQYHLPLTRMTKTRLEKLAEVKGLSTTAMLDAIINTAYERDCLGENGEELY